jgi:hypothetical protein
MTFSDDGQTVTLTIVEYGQLAGVAEKAVRDANERVAAARADAGTSKRLLEECMNKDANVRYQLDLKTALQRHQDNAGQIVRLAENFMREVYHECANVGRTNRTELEEKMKQLRGY